MLSLTDAQRPPQSAYGMARRNSEVQPRRIPWRAFVLLVLTACIALAFAWLRSGLQEVSRELQIQQRKLVLRGEELDNLLVQAESFRSGDYILAECRELGLHPPLPGQVRRINLKEPSAPTLNGAEEALFASSEESSDSSRTP
ncbi:MAG: hypothetical protein ACOCWJ_05105 [Verrucomicrobiota bacterium]